MTCTNQPSAPSKPLIGVIATDATDDPDPNITSGSLGRQIDSGNYVPRSDDFKSNRIIANIRWNR